MHKTSGSNLRAHAAYHLVFVTLAGSIAEKLAGKLLTRERLSSEEIKQDILIGYEKHAELIRG